MAAIPILTLTENPFPFSPFRPSSSPIPPSLQSRLSLHSLNSQLSSALTLVTNGLIMSALHIASFVASAAAALAAAPSSESPAHGVRNFGASPAAHFLVAQARALMAHCHLQSAEYSSAAFYGCRAVDTLIPLARHFALPGQTLGTHSKASPSPGSAPSPREAIDSLLILSRELA